MEKKKISILFLLGLVLAASTFFALRQIGQSKKTVNVIVAESGEEKKAESQEAQEIAVANELGADKQDGNATDGKAASSTEQPLATNKQSSATGQPAKDNPDKIATDKQQTTDNSKNSNNADAGKIVSELVSWGFQKSSGRTIKAIIVHTSYNNLGGDVFDFDKVLQEWKDAGVAPHYAIDRSGVIHQLVSDNNIAWHAGVSKLPDGTTDVNRASIGIEIINSQDSKFTDQQYAALNSLIATLKKKNPIKYILGHDEIAPGRKTDPWGIAWNKVQK
ncbi:MAG: N-acetylmuramoyl-L-alanine amidase [Candidatus Moranbacteria bacterium]|nr:N-acetylmuramoyl-L-alanine amidase [Candidatus Moranbacteria bacterium]